MTMSGTAHLLLLLALRHAAADECPSLSCLLMSYPNRDVEEVKAEKEWASWVCHQLQVRKFQPKNIWWSFDVVYLGGGFKYSFVHSVVSNILYFHPYLGKISNLTYSFQMGWFNHQPVYHCLMISFGASGGGFWSMDDSGSCKGW